jgi:uncharacterized protein (TIRG00374 family)
MAHLRNRLITGLLLGFLVILGLLLLGDVQKVGERFSTFNWSLAPLILASTLFNYLLRFIKWHYYLGLIGASGLPLLESAKIFIGGFPLAVTPGKVGEALKGVWLKQATRTPIARGVPVVMAERISDGLAVLVLSTLGVIAYPRYWPAFALVLGGLLLFILVTQIRSFAHWVLGLLKKLPLLQSYSQAFAEFYEGSYLLFRPKATLIAVTLGIVAWFGEGIAMYLVLMGLGIPTGGQTLLIAVFVLSFSTVIGAISALPGGLIAAEGSIAGMLVYTLSLPSSTAATATLLIRFATLWFGVSLGLVVWLIARDLFTFEDIQSSTS